MKTSAIVLGLSAAAVLSSGGLPALRAQSEAAPCTSFSPLGPDVADPLSITVPLAYGSFADIEVATLEGETVQLQVDVFEESAIRDRAIRVILPGRVELVSDLLDVDNLFELGSPLVVRIRASAPIAAVLVRRP